VFWDEARLLHAWRSPGRVWLLTGRSPEQGVLAGLPDAQVVAAGGGRWLYVNPLIDTRDQVR
jgi:hypothetical protein